MAPSGALWARTLRPGVTSGTRVHRGAPLDRRIPDRLRDGRRSAVRRRLRRPTLRRVPLPSLVDPARSPPRALVVRAAGSAPRDHARTPRGLGTLHRSRGVPDRQERPAAKLCVALPREVGRLPALLLRPRVAPLRGDARTRTHGRRPRSRRDALSRRLARPALRTDRRAGARRPHRESRRQRLDHPRAAIREAQPRAVRARSTREPRPRQEPHDPAPGRRRQPPGRRLRRDRALPRAARDPPLASSAVRPGTARPTAGQAPGHAHDPRLARPSRDRRGPPWNCDSPQGRRGTLLGVDRRCRPLRPQAPDGRTLHPGFIRAEGALGEGSGATRALRPHRGTGGTTGSRERRRKHAPAVRRRAHRVAPALGLLALGADLPVSRGVPLFHLVSAKPSPAVLPRNVVVLGLFYPLLMVGLSLAERGFVPALALALPNLALAGLGVLLVRRVVQR